MGGFGGVSGSDVQGGAFSRTPNSKRPRWRPGLPILDRTVPRRRIARNFVSQTVFVDNPTGPLKIIIPGQTAGANLLRHIEADEAPTGVLDHHPTLPTVDIGNAAFDHSLNGLQQPHSQVEFASRMHKANAWLTQTQPH